MYDIDSCEPLVARKENGVLKFFYGGEEVIPKDDNERGLCLERAFKKKVDGNTVGSRLRKLYEEYMAVITPREYTELVQLFDKLQTRIRDILDPRESFYMRATTYGVRLVVSNKPAVELPAELLQGLGLPRTGGIKLSDSFELMCHALQPSFLQELDFALAEQAAGDGDSPPDGVEVSFSTETTNVEAANVVLLTGEPCKFVARIENRSDFNVKDINVNILGPAKQFLGQTLKARTGMFAPHEITITPTSPGNFTLAYTIQYTRCYDNKVVEHKGEQKMTVMNSVLKPGDSTKFVTVKKTPNTIDMEIDPRYRLPEGLMIVKGELMCACGRRLGMIIPPECPKCHKSFG